MIRNVKFNALNARKFKNPQLKSVKDVKVYAKIQVALV
jgi:hypothetical protein